MTRVLSIPVVGQPLGGQLARVGWRRLYRGRELTPFGVRPCVRCGDDVLILLDVQAKPSEPQAKVAAPERRKPARRAPARGVSRRIIDRPDLPAFASSPPTTTSTDDDAVEQRKLRKRERLEIIRQRAEARSAANADRKGRGAVEIGNGRRSTTAMLDAAESQRIDDLAFDLWEEQ